MGRKNNVNPDHYKEDGRERPGQDINQEIQKQKFTQAANEQRIAATQVPARIEKIVTETSEEELKTTVGQVKESANSSANK